MNTSLSLESFSQSPSISHIVKEYGNRLFGFIRKKVKSLEDAEDILQDVWFQLSNLSGLENIESMSGWLFRTARNKVIDRYRKKSHQSIDVSSFTTDDEEFPLKEILIASSGDDPDFKLYRDIFWKEFTHALDELPEKQRFVFVRNEMEDQTLQEIADATGENIKTIISRKSYAVKHLRERLHYLYDEFLND